jgi:hypothetical protein
MKMAVFKYNVFIRFPSVHYLGYRMVSFLNTKQSGLYNIRNTSVMTLFELKSYQ